MTYLFIGGRADGKRIAVPDGISVYRVPHNSGYDTYHRMQLAGADGTQFVVYVYEYLNGTDVIRLLIYRYPVPFNEGTLEHRTAIDGFKTVEKKVILPR
jgi:hypothetical protein